MLNSIMLMLNGKLPSDAATMMNIRTKLEQKSDDELQKVSMGLSMVKLKDPIIALVLSFFLGGLGVDRFYLGQVGLGIFKLILNLCFIGFIWTIIDWFLIMGKTKKVNYEKVIMVL